MLARKCKIGPNRISRFRSIRRHTFKRENTEARVLREASKNELHG
jgi:hypothetical protein